MTEYDFTRECAKRCTGVVQASAFVALNSGQSKLFVQEMLEQDSDEGSRSGTKHALGDELYAELQNFKTT